MSFRPNDESSDIQIPQPAIEVGFNIATYVRGAGVSLRAVAVPGSDREMFAETTSEDGLCECSQGSAWVLTAIDPQVLPGMQPVVKQLFTLDAHAAMAWLRNPEAVFGLPSDDLAMLEDVTLVTDGEALETVIADLTGWLSKTDPELGDSDVIQYYDIDDGLLGEQLEAFLSNPEGPQGGDNA